MLKYQDRLDEVFDALSDVTRRGIVSRLAAGDLTVSELAEPLEMSLPAVHQHLAILHEAGLVTSEKTGRVRTCRLELKALDVLDDWVRDRRRMWERRLDRLETYLDETGEDG